MAAPKRKKVTSLVLIAVLIGVMWGFISWKSYTPQLGLDLQGGISVVLTPEGEPDPGALEKAVDIIRDRVDALGVAEPDITQQGGNILVQIAGIKEDEQDRAFELIGTTAKLRFRPVLEQLPSVSLADEAAAGANDGLPVCGKPETYPEDDPAKEVVFCVEQKELPADQWPRLRLGPAALEGTDVKGASAQLDPSGTQGWFISLDLTGEGSRKFKEVTGKLACNRGQGAQDQLAIVLDREVQSHPQMGDEVRCNEGIAGGTAQITGLFTDQEAKDLALVLRYGALPVELEPTTTTTVSPTLGKESLRSGLLAALIGIGIVFVYVLFFYRALGFIIWLGIGVHAAITLAVIILLGQTAGFTLSLAGIAGLIVSLGISADSFIVYFERLKDEVLAGKTVRASVDRAWASARRTIIAADLVTALAALVLYFLAVGGVRGFALMLGLATALDLAVSFWFMHPAVWLLAQTKILGGSKTLGMNAAGGGVLQPEGSRA